MPPKNNLNARFWQAMRAAERKIIEYYLNEAGSVRDAAKLMEMDKAWLYRKMRTLGISNPHPKRAPVSMESPDLLPLEDAEDTADDEDFESEDFEDEEFTEELHDDA